METIEGAESVNTLIEEVNQLTGKWDEIMDPINKFKKDSLKSCGMEKTAGANIKHAVMGSIVGMMAES